MDQMQNHLGNYPFILSCFSIQNVNDYVLLRKSLLKRLGLFRVCLQLCRSALHLCLCGCFCLGLLFSKSKLAAILKASPLYWSLRFAEVQTPAKSMWHAKRVSSIHSVRLDILRLAKSMTCRLVVFQTLYQSLDVACVNWRRVVKSHSLSSKFAAQGSSSASRWWGFVFVSSCSFSDFITVPLSSWGDQNET